MSLDSALIPVSECRFCAIDFESAGAVRGHTDAPVQIGLAVGGCDVWPPEVFVSHLRVEQPIQWSAQKVHGITTADLADAPPLAMLWPEIKPRMRGSVIVAHGKGTEKRFLRAFPGHGFGPWLDTLLLARAAWPDLPDHGLGPLCDALGLVPSVREAVPEKSWHDALFDAVASLILLRHLIDALALREHPVAALVRPDTSAWHRVRNS